MIGFGISFRHFLCSWHSVFLPPPVPKIALAENMTERAVLRQAVQTFDRPPCSRSVSWLGDSAGTAIADWTGHPFRLATWERYGPRPKRQRHDRLWHTRSRDTSHAPVPAGARDASGHHNHAPNCCPCWCETSRSHPVCAGRNNRQSQSADRSRDAGISFLLWLPCVLVAATGLEPVTSSL